MTKRTNLGCFLAKLRVDADVTLHNFSKGLGINPGQLSQVETGKVKLTPLMLERLMLIESLTPYQMNELCVAVANDVDTINIRMTDSNAVMIELAVLLVAINQHMDDDFIRHQLCIDAVEKINQLCPEPIS